jgi:hypothetical protein
MKRPREGGGGEGRWRWARGVEAARHEWGGEAMGPEVFTVE